MERKPLFIAGGITKSITKGSKMMLRAVLSSETVDRYGDVILASAYNTPTNFKNYFDGNPVVKWAHGRDCSAPDLPLGKVLNPSFDTLDINGNKAFEGDVQFTDAHQFAIDVWKLYEGGYLKCFSVGFLPKQASKEPVAEGQTGYTFQVVDLLENSAVPIPANPAAMKKAFEDGVVDVDFLERSFFSQRDQILVQNRDIFVPFSWNYKDSINAMANLAEEVRAGTLKQPAPRPEKAQEKEKSVYECLACDATSEVDPDAFPEVDAGGGLKYRNIECSGCGLSLEDIVIATEILETL